MSPVQNLQRALHFVVGHLEPHPAWHKPRPERIHIPVSQHRLDPDAHQQRPRKLCLSIVIKLADRFHELQSIPLSPRFTLKRKAIARLRRMPWFCRIMDVGKSPSLELPAS